MKKSELIERLQKIEGDPEIGFSVNNELFDNDSYFSYFDCIKKIEKKELAIYNENIFEKCDNDFFIYLTEIGGLTSNEAIEKINNSLNEKIIIDLDVKWREI